ncbi:MAG: AzlC family ABC transporter permease [SAR324 cluster bacterium]|nr:AzlC family ABC transporter permease [SAR324 cluster bacterium]
MNGNLILRFLRIGKWISPEISAGLKLALPIIIGYIPIGIAFGVLSRKVGVSSFNTVMMSLIVFAGSSQLIAVGLFLAGASAVSIIITTFIVNLRHFLMTAALSPFLKSWRKPELAFFAFEVTDETFGIHAAMFASGEYQKESAFTVNIAAQISWLVGTWIGIAASQIITDIELLALDFALPAMFIGLLVVATNDRIKTLVAIIAGSLSVLFFQLQVEQWNVILATLIGATSGVLLKRWIKN